MNLNDFPQLTISDVNSALGMERIDADFIVAQPGEREARLNLFDFPTRFEGGAFAICLGGKATVTINLTKYTLREGTMIMIPSYSIIQFHEHTPDFKSYMAGFSPHIFEGLKLHNVIPLMTEIMENPVFELSNEDAKMIMRSCKYIYEKSRDTDHPNRRDIMQHLILAMLYEVSYIFRKQHPGSIHRPLTHNEEIMENFGRLVAKHYKTERNVKFYANELCLTSKYLSTLIKKTSGRSVPEWIRVAVMMDAKVQLKYTTLTVQQISEELHFPNPSFFGRFFRKHAGMTPLEYRMN